MKLLSIFLLSMLSINTYSNGLELHKTDSSENVSMSSGNALEKSSNDSKSTLYLQSDKVISAFLNNLAGNKVAIFENNKLDISDLPKGAYWVNIREDSRTFRYPINIE